MKQVLGSLTSFALLSWLAAACGQVVTSPITGPTGPGMVAGTTGSFGAGGSGAGASGTGASGMGAGDTGASSPGGGDCPGTQPEVGSSCPLIGAYCNYGGTQCACEFASTWQCSTCPTTQPAESSPCVNTPGMGLDVCDYDNVQCVCLSSSGNAWSWTCSECPATEPAAGSDCSATSFIAGFACAYGDDECRCSSETWDCGVISCPATQPAPGDGCALVSSQSCTYGQATCYCMGGKFYCD